MDNNEKYLKIAHLIGTIYFYGNFKAETASERELQKLLEETGHFYKSEDEVLAGKDIKVKTVNDIIAEYQGNTKPHVEQEGIHCNR